MTFPTMAAARLFGNGIAMQDDASDLPPVRAVPVGVQQAQVGDIVLLVIGRDGVSARRFVRDVGIEFDYNWHNYSPSPKWLGLRYAPANILYDSW